MRKAFASAVIQEHAEDYFLTGDLGFMALEEVRAALGDRFINCGVAEQNMVGVAAGLAREGFRPFVYSIAPFIYARAFEQIRNDLAFTGLPVRLVGNGGGYGYGVMGPTHHALEDCAALNALGVKALIPAFDADIAPLLRARPAGPCYLRLGREELPPGFFAPDYAPWRRLLAGGGGALAALGPLGGLAWGALLDEAEAERPEVWAVTELPLPAPPEEFLAAAEESPLYILEEHTPAGGLAMQLCQALFLAGVRPERVERRQALGYPSGRYGSQNFHRRECGLDAASLRALAGGGGGVMQIPSLSADLRSLPGPILIIGASGFVGANLLRALLRERDDVAGTFFSGRSWRLAGLAAGAAHFLNLQDPLSVGDLFRRTAPKTIFDCSAFGGYPFERDPERIHATNYLCFIRLLEEASRLAPAAYIHAGSSSEYGLNAAAPAEDAPLLPNSHYAVSKAGAAAACAYFGKCRGLPVANLRLYSVYGPWEDSSRLIPTLCEHALRGELPPLVGPRIARDFIHADDVSAAFVRAALAMGPETAGESFNIGTGRSVALAELAALAKRLFNIQAEPRYSQEEARSWDLEDWRANTEKAGRLLGWRPAVALEDGLRETAGWWRERLLQSDFRSLTKKAAPAGRHNSLSAIIACYRDGEAIPVMYERLTATLRRLELDYEIIFVNDGSPDDSEERIRDISSRDPRVLGLTHSRNFGSQAAFRSGLELASKEACVLLDGDLQDPPELLEAFVQKWREGANVVYGRRVKREMPWALEQRYRLFYRLFDLLSDIPMPRDAGDFSLLDRAAVYWLLRCNERDSFLRGLRSYVGFTQVGVDYVRPERLFGRSTNNWIKNIGWAKKAVFAFSRLPLHLLTAVGGLAFAASVLLGLTALATRLFSPESAPRGITTMLLVELLFGSATLLGLGILGEYIGKIMEETKARPPFIRRHVISRGQVRDALSREGEERHAR